MSVPETLGHYRILGPLGQGGMGEVYLAEDTRLHRKVAIKVLPPLMANDPERRQRFEREAHTVAALNHPNIVTIHAVEEAGGTPFLVMELVEGTPLSDEIPRGGLPLDKLLRVAIPTADALAAAQERGITHRDLKPSNIMLTRDGRVKVLDFGLAKLREVEIAAASDDVTRMPTGELTGEGKIIGTVAYMSPEQAEGKPVDPRSDIFSLGVVLHEMATGDRPFKGDTNVSIISSILKDTPSSVTDLNPKLPPDLARIVRRCLSKDPARRYQTAADVRTELEDLKQDLDSHTSGVVSVPTVRRRRLVWIAPALLAGLALAAVAWFLAGHWPGSARPESSRFAIDHLTRLTTAGTVSLATLSRDGRYVVHVKGSATEPSLWVRQTATSSDVQIVPPQPVVYDGLAFSPDGNYVYYSAYKRPGGGLAPLNRIPVLGGAPTLVLNDIDSAITFAPDGRQFAFMRGMQEKGTTVLLVASADGSSTRELAQLQPPDKFQNEQPSWSPDGKTILATAMRRTATVGVFAVDVATARTSQIGGEWGFVRNVQWLPDGRSFLVDAIDLNLTNANPQIWRVLYPSGERSRVTNDLNAYKGVSTSADGLSIATVQTETTAGIEISAVGGHEWHRITGGSGRADGAAGLAWLPDGRIVYTSTTMGMPQLWIVDADGNNARQLTTLSGPAAWPSPSADGRWIYFQAHTKEGVCLYRIAPDGLGLQQLTHGGDEYSPVISPDGYTVFCTRVRSGQPRPAKIPADGGEPVAVADVYFRTTSVSPDGARLLGGTWDAVARRPAMATMPVGGGPLQLVPNLTSTAEFSVDGRSFVYADQTTRPISFWSRPIAGGPAEPIAAPVDGLVLAGASSRDRRVAISHGTQTSDVVLITATTAPER